MTAEWRVRRLLALAEVDLGRQRSPDRDQGPNMVPYLRAANVKDGFLDLRDIKEMDFSASEQKLYALRSGDVLVTEGSGSLSAIGATAVWNGEIEGTVCFQNHLLRLRPRATTDARFLAWWARHAQAAGLFASIASGANIYNLGAERVRLLPVAIPDLGEQQAIADYLGAEISAMDTLLAQKHRLVELLQERIDAEIMELVGRSTLVHADGPLGAVPLRQRLAKLDRPQSADAQVITAFRDGQVTARAFRRSDGYTESWTDGARVQGVRTGDVVVHGLDGFAGAIGASEADGVCSPVYHVCSPVDGGDADFCGRFLRLLATTGYLSNFATSTRERAVDFRNWELFGSIPIPVVEAEVQRRIGDRIRRLAPIQELVDRSQILINERKRTLITAAMTGALDTPGVAA